MYILYNLFKSPVFIIIYIKQNKNNISIFMKYNCLLNYYKFLKIKKMQTCLKFYFSFFKYILLIEIFIYILEKQLKILKYPYNLQKS